MATPFGSYDAQKCAGRREFFDASVTRVGDQNISVAINSNSGRRIKLSLCRFPYRLRNMLVALSGRELSCSGLIERSSRQAAHALLKLMNVLVRDIQDVKRP